MNEGNVTSVTGCALSIHFDVPIVVLWLAYSAKSSRQLETSIALQLLGTSLKC